MKNENPHRFLSLTTNFVLTSGGEWCTLLEELFPTSDSDTQAEYRYRLLIWPKVNHHRSLIDPTLLMRPPMTIMALNSISPIPIKTLRIHDSNFFTTQGRELRYRFRMNIIYTPYLMLTNKRLVYTLNIKVSTQPQEYVSYHWWSLTSICLTIVS